MSRLKQHPKNKSAFFLFVFLVILISPLEAQWREIEKGFSYRKTELPLVHFFKVDPQKYRFDILLASDYGTSALTAENFRNKSRALFVINGSFFDEAYRSLGLLVRNGKLLQSLRKTSWGVFGFKGQLPFLIHPKDWKLEGVSLAIQVGPRLVVDGHIPSFRETGPARRSAIGITSDGSILLALSETLLSLRQWAEIIRPECPQALNLDGGGSSQLSVKLSGFSLQIPGMTAVPNAIGVFGK